ncbi:hypothetical protein LDENG_00069560 [Lucifuga dentata]|nr:hypothetical protein LDENG_00069560 [Lucifuga dentata]
MDSYGSVLNHSQLLTSGLEKTSPAWNKPTHSRSSSTLSSPPSRQIIKDWEVIDDLQLELHTGGDSPQDMTALGICEGYLLKRRKWPLKGWHKYQNSTGMADIARAPKGLPSANTGVNSKVSAWLQQTDDPDSCVQELNRCHSDLSELNRLIQRLQALEAGQIFTNGDLQRIISIQNLSLEKPKKPKKMWGHSRTLSLGMPETVRGSCHMTPSEADSADEYFDANDDILWGVSSEISVESGLSDGSTINSEPEEGHASATRKYRASVSKAPNIVVPKSTGRRTTLPAHCPDNSHMGLVAILYNNIGKNLY